MNAKETKIQPLIEGTKQFLVPLFQRPYSWENKHWQTLWDDLYELYEEDSPRIHFIGSVVTMPAISVPEGVTKYVLIDGQQRLTTILILLALIRDLARHHPGSLADQIENLLLLNPYQTGNDRYKLLPTQADRDSFMNVVRSDPASVDDRITQAYRFFSKQIGKIEGINLDKLRSIIEKQLVLVSIVLDTQDNPHLIFESLNAKGRALTQADLIRNYFFMRIHSDQQESMYSAFWEPLQARLGNDLTECIRHFLMKDGSIVKQGEVFYTLKERADRRSEAEVIKYLQELVAFAGYYERFLHPDRETDAVIRTCLIHLNRLDITTAYPYLLNVFHAYSEATLSRSQLADILEVLESFIMRRFVCGVPTNALNKIFPPLYSQSSQYEDLVTGLKSILSTKNFPNDTEFRERFVSTRFYGGDRAVKAKFILERLEGSFEHNEVVLLDNLTIEHVMPQTLTESWKHALGVDWEVIHSNYLHTIGNLTLSGYNPHLSNADFATKQTILDQSHLELNKYFQNISLWDNEAIRLRAETLAARAVGIWVDFSPEPASCDILIDGSLENESSGEAYDVAQVLLGLGGGVIHATDSRQTLYKLSDDKIVVLKYSKLYIKNNYYWYGLRPRLFEEIEQLGITHVVFVMGRSGIAVVPVELLHRYRLETKASKHSDGSIRHYHLLISNESPPSLYWSAETPRYGLGPYYKSLTV